MSTDEAASGPGAAPEPENGEDEARKLTRNLNELLQELRVMQTGVQILTGFLLTVPFTARFPELEPYQKHVYLGVLSASIVTTGLIVAPVAFHRTLFRQGERRWIVEATNRAARYGLVTLAVTMAGVMWLVFDVTVGLTAAHVAGATTIAMFALLWVVLPVASRRMSTRRVRRGLRPPRS